MSQNYADSAKKSQKHFITYLLNECPCFHSPTPCFSPTSCSSPMPWPPHWLSKRVGKRTTIGDRSRRRRKEENFKRGFFPSTAPFICLMASSADGPTRKCFNVSEMPVLLKMSSTAPSSHAAPSRLSASAVPCSRRLLIRAEFRRPRKLALLSACWWRSLPVVGLLSPMPDPGVGGASGDSSTSSLVPSNSTSTSFLCETSEVPVSGNFRPFILLRCSGILLL